MFKLYITTPQLICSLPHGHAKMLVNEFRVTDKIGHRICQDGENKTSAENGLANLNTFSSDAFFLPGTRKFSQAQLLLRRMLQAQRSVEKTSEIYSFLALLNDIIVLTLLGWGHIFGPWECRRPIERTGD